MNIINHLRYLKYVLHHKWFVFLGCWHYRVPLWQSLIHDWTKFTPIEWFAYVDRFSKGRGSTWQSVEDTPEYNRAWEHHWSSNRHHWEYWLIPFRDDVDQQLTIGDCVSVESDGRLYPCIIVGTRSGDTSNYKVESRSDPRGKFWVFNNEIRHIVNEMPDRYIREMVADWYGAGMAQQKPDIAAWRKQNGWRQTLHPNTTKRVEELLQDLPK